MQIVGALARSLRAKVSKRLLLVSDVAIPSYVLQRATAELWYFPKNTILSKNWRSYSYQWETNLTFMPNFCNNQLIKT